jgi:hypothetical protein
MVRCPAFIQRLVVAGLTAGVLATGAFSAATAGADTPPARATGATTATGATGAVAAPTLNVFVSPGGTEATADAISSVPTTITYTVQAITTTGTPVGPGAGLPLRGVVAPISGVLSTGNPPPPPQYDTKHHLNLTGLKSNTTYDLDVTGTTQQGKQLTAHARFTTLKKRVRITLDKIVVQDDGDTFGSGEPTWFWQMSGFSGGPLADCFPKDAGHCKEGDYSEGTIIPNCTRGGRDHRTCAYSYVFAEENFQPIPNPHPQPGGEDFSSMPQQFQIKVSAKESDYPILGGLDSLLDWGAWLGSSQETSWSVPQGKESASQQVAVSADDGNFRSSMVFTFQLFHDNQTYSPTDGRVASAAK